MFAKPTRLLILLVFTALGAQVVRAVEVPELVKLRDSFEERRNTDLGALVDKYVDALKRLEKDLADNGALEEALVVREYRLKVGLTRGEGDLDESKAPAKLLDLKKVFDKARDSKLAPLEKIYIGELGKLEKRLVALDRLRDAVAVKKVREGMVAKRAPKKPDPASVKPLLPTSPDMEPLRKEALVYWDFEGDNKRKASDRSPGGNLGILRGATIETDSKRGQVASFKEKTDSITLHPIAGYKGGSVTLAMWLKCDSDLMAILSYGSPLNAKEFFLLSDNNGFKFYRSQAPIGAKFRLRSGKWTHLAVSYKGATGDATIYVDGRARSSESLVLREIRADGFLALGSEQSKSQGTLNPKFGFIGEIDDFMFFPRALSAQEIATIHRSGQGL